MIHEGDEDDFRLGIQSLTIEVGESIADMARAYLHHLCDRVN
jgi:hypothetical protein